MSTSNYSKSVILTMIKDDKELLFGTLTHPMTNEDRHDAWKEIHEKAKSLGVVRAEKTWEYLRDVTWANWKRRTLVKRDNKRKTGTGGGKEVKYTDLDNLVLDIIGRDSPLVQGLNVPESIPDDIENESELLSPRVSPNVERGRNSKTAGRQSGHTTKKDATRTKPKVMLRYTTPQNEPVPSTSTNVDAEDAEAAKDIRTRKLERPGKKRHSSVADTNITAKKQQLQIELMEIDKRTKAIQLYKLEKKFELPPSPFTQEFHDAISDAMGEN